MEKFVESFKLNLVMGLGIYFFSVLGASFFGGEGFRWVSGVFLIFAIGYIIFTIVRLWKIKKTDSAFKNESSYVYAVMASVAGFFLALLLFLLLFGLIIPNKDSGFPCGVISSLQQGEGNFWVKTILFLQPLSSFFSDLFSVVSIAALAFSAIALISLFSSKQSKDNPIRRLAVIFLIITLVAGLLFALVVTSLNDARVKSIDSRRVGDIKQTQLALELYLDGQYYTVGRDEGRYPIVNGNSAEERWENLSKFLTPDFIAYLHNDPCVEKGFPKHRYDYKNSPDGKTFVIKAILSHPENPNLMNDLDGEVLGLWCGEQGQEIEYCENNE